VNHQKNRFGFWPMAKRAKYNRYLWYQIYVSVLYFKSNDQNPTIDPPFRPPNAAGSKQYRQGTS
jgi:hypothetical protein